MSGWNTAKTPSRNERLKLPDVVDLFPFKERNNEFVAARAIGDVWSQAEHWMEILTKDGNKSSVMRLCLKWDHDTQSFDKNKKCPYCDCGSRASVVHLGNFIFRELQEKQPRKLPKPEAEERKPHKVGGKTVFFKKMGSKTWTPVRVVRSTSTLTNKFKGLTALNKHKVDGKVQTFDLSHPKYGMDVNIKFDKDAPGTAMWDAQKDDKTALTEEERNYHIYKLDTLLPDSLEEALADMKELKKILVDGGDSDDGDDEDDVRKKKSKSKKKSRDDDFDDDDDDLEDIDLDDDEDEDEDEEEQPRKKKSSKKTVKKSSKKRSRDYDEDDDEDDFDDDSEDFDDDDDDDDEDDEDERPAKKKKTVKKSSKRSRDDYDDDEDEEEEQPRKKKTVKKRR